MTTLIDFKRMINVKIYFYFSYFNIGNYNIQLFVSKKYHKKEIIYQKYQKTK